MEENFNEEAENIPPTSSHGVILGILTEQAGSPSLVPNVLFQFDEVANTPPATPMEDLALDFSSETEPELGTRQRAYTI